MHLITQIHSGKIPVSFVVKVEVPGIYLIKTTPKNMTYTINNVHGEGAFDLEEGQYMITIYNPKNMTFKFVGKLMLSDEDRENQIEQMRIDLENE